MINTYERICKKSQCFSLDFKRFKEVKDYLKREDDFDMKPNAGDVLNYVGLPYL